MTQFQVKKSDLASVRQVETPKASPGDSEAILRVDRFALTANNVSYGVIGERLGYWNFFPPAQADGGDWGIIPVWGYADVIESNVADLNEGDRLYGYFPMADTLTITPTKIRADRVTDGAEHRAGLPPVYNQYQRGPREGKDMEAARMLLLPLYLTSFYIHDLLVDNDWFGAERVITVSASSKTAIGFAYAMQGDSDAPDHRGLTSAGNRDFVNTLKAYGAVESYDDIAGIDASVPTVIIDMSGNGAILGQLHKLLGDNMKYTANVGLTHWEDNKMSADFIRDRSAMFFAPGQIQKRAQEFGAAVYEEKTSAYFKGAAKRSLDWLELKTVKDLANLEPVYQDMLGGRINPVEGVLVEPN
ncbi:MAG: DUF2855 family protein [Pseudomonadota bacterium]